MSKPLEPLAQPASHLAEAFCQHCGNFIRLARKPALIFLDGLVKVSYLSPSKIHLNLQSSGSSPSLKDSVLNIFSDA
jgi:hypothetical protein